MRRAVVRHGSVLYQLPTGGGKTVVAGAISAGAAAKRTTTLLLVHRRELIHQAAATLQTACPDLTIGYEAPGMPSIPWAPLQIGMVQSVARREHVTTPGLVVIDEAHHVRAATWERVLERWPGVPRVGLTATPARLDGKGLGAHFSALVQGPTIAELVAAGHLAPVRVLRVPAGAISRSGLRTRAGDYQARELGERVTGSVIASAADAYERYTPGRQAIFFGGGRRHSMAVADDLVSRGISAAHVDGTDHAAHRDRIMQRFRDRDLQVVCNVDLISEGYDAPACEVVMLGMLTRSVVRYLQAVGRGRRPAPGKTAVVLDLGGSSHELGLPDDHREWSLADGLIEPDRESAPPEPRPCRACGSLIRAATCPWCGAVQGEAVQETVVDLEEATPQRPARRTLGRKQMLADLAAARRSPEPRRELERIAAAANMRPTWVASVLRTWGLS